MRVERCLDYEYNVKSFGDDLIFTFSRIIVIDSFLGSLIYLIIGGSCFHFSFWPKMLPGMGFILWFRP